LSERLDQYFVFEANDYLDQLQTLLSAPGRPDLDQFLRLCMGVRGSAQMAGAESVAVVAERLESGVRSVQGNHVVWSEEIRTLSLQTVADLKVLVRASSRWGQREEGRVRDAIERWDAVEPAPHESESRNRVFEEEPSGEEPDSRHRAFLSPEVDVESLFYDDGGPHVLTSNHEDDMNQPTVAGVPSPVPIESLLLDRDGALREALAMRDELERTMRGVPGAELELASSMRELFELLEHAAGGAAARG
jgi:chemotaxis protein histidine kinase CheA